MFQASRLFCGAAYLLVFGGTANSPWADLGPIPPGTSPTRIAFASHRDGNWEIYVADADGRRQTRLTRSELQDRFPLWSPDRSKIAFASQVGGDHWELWLMNADGSSPRFLATQIVAKGHRQWSRDGKRIVFAAKLEGDAEIVSVEVESGRLVRLTNSPGEDADPSWSPDDTHVVFSSTRDGNPEIYLMRGDGTQPRRLTNHVGADTRPAWAPDASRIAFVSTRDGNRDIYLARVDDGRVERLTNGGRATNDGASWSPNGAYIAVQTAARDNYDIQLVRMTDHKQWTVAGTPAYDGQFSWSPSGDQLAFISGRDGFDAVYLTDLTGKVNRLTATPSLNPDWSP